MHVLLSPLVHNRTVCCQLFLTLAALCWRCWVVSLPITCGKPVSTPPSSSGSPSPLLVRNDNITAESWSHNNTGSWLLNTLCVLLLKTVIALFLQVWSGRRCSCWQQDLQAVTTPWLCPSSPSPRLWAECRPLALTSTTLTLLLRKNYLVLLSK